MAADLTNNVFGFSDDDIVRKTSNVKQLVDILSVDVSSVSGTLAPDETTNTKTRKKYEVFVTGGVGEGIFPVTSSLFQTVFDQNYETQTANELLDITIGCYHGSDLVQNTLDTTQGLEDPDNPGTYTGIDASGKYLFSNDVLMMREKISIYKQYAKYLLGNSESYFVTPFEEDFSHKENNALTYRERIDEAVFINFKRLFVRDGIDKEQFALSLLNEAHSTTSGSNIGIESDSTSEVIVTDTDAKSSLRVTSICGSIGTLVKDNPGSGEDPNVGLIFYEKGIVVLDAKKVFNPTQIISGSISAVSGTAPSFSNGTLDFNEQLIPNFWATGSIDDIVDHVCNTRFKRDYSSAIGFVNDTFINSTIYICRVGPSQANFSRNPTYTKDDGTIRVIEERGDDPFSYVTTIGLYNGKDLLAVAKTSRPIEKNPEVDLSISVRIDY